MQGITSGGGGLYYNVGSLSGSGAGNKIVNNLKSTIFTDSSDQSIPGFQGTATAGMAFSWIVKSAALDVENNVIFRVSDASVGNEAKGPPKRYPGNTFRNNIFADARKSMFRFPEPQSPEGHAEMGESARQLRQQHILSGTE